MIRKLNYTGRQKILVKDVRTTTRRVKSNLHKAHLSLDLTRYRPDLPPDAVVFFEAYTRTRVERYKVGIVHELDEIVEFECSLEPFTDVEVEGIHFRIKIVDQSGKHGRIVRIADRIPRHSQESADRHRKSILGVSYDDLGDRLWQLDLETGNMPYLILNENLAAPHRLARENDLFFALVYPQAVEHVLQEVLLDSPDSEDYSDSDDEDDWRFLWTQFALKLCGASSVPRGAEQRKEFIDDCVKAFCTRYGTLRRAEKALGGGE